jgi:hypothetical protein
LSQPPASQTQRTRSVKPQLPATPLTGILIRPTRGQTRTPLTIFPTPRCQRSKCPAPVVANRHSAQW